MDAIRENKQFRKDADELLQRIKSSDRQSSERSLAITNFQQGIMWLGMDLKAIAADMPKPTPIGAARVAYEAYCKATGGMNFRGERCPEFDDLPGMQQCAWVAAAHANASDGNPYPQSYNPDSPVVEPTSDGLML
jgi:hypothetical protein